MDIKCYILARSQGIFYMHQANVPIVVDYCTKYEQKQPLLKFGNRTTCYFYTHQQHMVPDYFTKYE